MTAKTSPQHRAEPNAETLKFNRVGENMERLHGVAVIVPGTGKRIAPSIMAAPETEAEVAA
jgi:hypothetical protein